MSPTAAFIACTAHKHAFHQVTGYGNKYILKRRQDGSSSSSSNGTGGGGKESEVTRLTARQIRDSVDASLQRLNCDYIDLLQVCQCWQLCAIASLYQADVYACKRQQTMVATAHSWGKLEVCTSWFSCLDE